MRCHLGFTIIVCCCVLLGFVESNINTRIQHELYFKQSRYSSVLNQDNKPMTVLNTFMGAQIYDRNQNIGIMLASGEDYDFCTSKTMSQSKITYIQQSFSLEMFLFIQVSSRCAFGSQVREAVLIGAKGVILYDPTGTHLQNPLPAVNSKTTLEYLNLLPNKSFHQADSISIPVLIVDQPQKGKQLLDLLSSEDFDGAYALCHISYSPPKKLSFPVVMYFSSSIHKDSISFFEDLYTFLKEYDPNANLTVQAIPHIYQSYELTKICTTVASSNCTETTESQILAQDCYSNGKYCSLHNAKYIKGNHNHNKRSDPISFLLSIAQEIVDHEIFQYELSLLSSLEWAKYMKSFIPQCYEAAERDELAGTLTECGEALLKSYNAPLLSSVIKSVRDSWLFGSDSDTIDKSTMENRSLNYARKMTLEYGVHQWPTLILNGAPVQDSKLYIYNYLSQVLCNSYLYPSKECLYLLHVGASTTQSGNYDDLGDDADSNALRSGKVIKPAQKSSVPKGWVITLSLLSGFLIGALIFWLLRRNHIKSMNELLHKKIKQAVTKYNQFNDANAQFEELV